VTTQTFIYKRIFEITTLKLSNLKPVSHVVPTDPLAAWRQARVSPDAAQQVELALPVATQVDGARRDVDVHQVVHDAALDVVLDPVHQVPAAHVEDLDVGQFPATRHKGNIMLL